MESGAGVFLIVLRWNGNMIVCSIVWMLMREENRDMIFCVEDDGEIRDLMIYTLHVAGWEAKGFTDGNGLFAALQAEKPCLILLDIMLPGEDGISILKKLRLQPATKEIPVIMATAKGTEYDKVTGLDLGADDYLAKPFGMMEMISRIRAVLRRANPRRSGKLLKMGKLELNPETCTVSVNQGRVQLTLKEYKLLAVFMENPGRVFTRDQLLSMIWGVEFMGETRTVDVHIRTLRMKLGECAAYLETVRGIGYRMGSGI